MGRRILGLETEYALLFQPEKGSSRPTPRRIYEALTRAIEKTHITLEALYRKEGRFLSNSAFIHYEAHVDAFSQGLIEAATPECRTPLDLMTYQRAIDEILAGAARDAERQLQSQGWFGKVLIGKNSADAFGHSYGCHENYMVEDPTGLAARIVLGIGLGITFFFLVLPFALTVLVLLLGLVGLLLGLSLLRFILRVASSIPWVGALFRLVDRPFEWLLMGLAGLRDEQLAKVTGLAMKYGLTPAITLYSAYLSRIVLRPYRKYLTAHLVSRLIFSGSGEVSCAETETGYRISQRAPRIRRLVKVYWDDARKPIYDIKQFVFEPFSAFRDRKRLHILFSDSNMAEVAQYLKVGTTALVIEAIEKGHSFSDLVLRSPVRAVRELSRAGHAARLKTAGGETLSALEIQQRYLGGVKASLAGETVSEEVRRLIELWEAVLRGIDGNPMGLERELDWVIKKRILDGQILGSSNWSEFVRWGRLLEEARLQGPGGLPESPEDLPEGVRRRIQAEIDESEGGAGEYLRFRDLYYAAKKADLKYHQIAPPGGYFQEMERSGLATRVTDPVAVEQAKVDPPMGTRARARGKIIRWSWDHQERALVGWKRVILRNLGKVIRLDDPFEDRVDLRPFEDPRRGRPALD